MGKLLEFWKRSMGIFQRRVNLVCNPHWIIIPHAWNFRFKRINNLKMSNLNLDRNGRELKNDFYLDNNSRICYITYNEEGLTISKSNEEIKIRPNEPYNYSQKLYLQELVPINPLEYLQKIADETRFVISKLSQLEKENNPFVTQNS